ncbi:hypothetical protein [Kitasatospora sp. GP82]|uniref:hypothetical protein n=1 Tax=Kitasatospora sp. GP82 TaxID=3035089 RepID=UPI002473C243|nr:hypothetical protein [Kitasatospora sp. GP82]
MPPDWLPHQKLRDLLEGYELGCVYWYENGAWSRAPYPEDLDDDGLDCGMSRFADKEEVLGMLDDTTAARRSSEALLNHAERYGLTPELLEPSVSDSGGERWDLPRP